MMKLINTAFRLMSVLLLLHWGFIEGLEGGVRTCIEYVKEGCFKDSLIKPRPLPKLIENYRSMFKWHFPEESINSEVALCAEAVSEKGFKVFGLQFYGECWSGETAAQTYDRDGESSRCIKAVNQELKPCNDDSDEACTGVGRTNYVYRIIESTDGNFSAWSTWSQCSRTCGGGQKKRIRLCSNPPPSKCGKPCLGNTEEVVDCNTHSCPEPCEDKSSQCKKYKELGLCVPSYPAVLEGCKKSCSRCP